MKLRQLAICRPTPLARPRRPRYRRCPSPDPAAARTNYTSFVGDTESVKDQWARGQCGSGTTHTTKMPLGLNLQTLKNHEVRQKPKTQKKQKRQRLLSHLIHIAGAAAISWPTTVPRGKYAPMSTLHTCEQKRKLERDTAMHFGLAASENP